MKTFCVLWTYTDTFSVVKSSFLVCQLEVTKVTGNTCSPLLGGRDQKSAIFSKTHRQFLLVSSPSARTGFRMDTTSNALGFIFELILFTETHITS
jgi:hypothetical protein